MNYEDEEGVSYEVQNKDRAFFKEKNKQETKEL